MRACISSTETPRRRRPIVPKNGLTNREIFQKLLDVVAKNHEVQKAASTAILAVREEIKALKEAIKALGETHKEAVDTKLWKVIYTLLGIILGLVGVKLAFPAL